MAYKTQPDRIILGDDDLVEPAEKKSRLKAQAACASARGDWAWMALDVCVSRHGGNLPKGAATVNGAPGVVEFLRKSVPEVVTSTQEHVLVLPISVRLQILGVAVVSKGARNMTMAPLGEIFAPVFMLPATSLILAHNHPSDMTSPSQEDVDLTKAVKDAAKTLGFRLLDHIIVAPTSYYSFAESRGL